MRKKPLRSGGGAGAPRYFGKIFQTFNPAGGHLPLLFLGLLLMVWLTKGVAEAPGKTPTPGAKAVTGATAQIAEKPTDVDALIDAYRQAPTEEKARLMQQIRSRIVEEVTGEQQTTIAELIRLKKLQAAERRHADRRRKASESTKKSREKPRRKRARSFRGCRGLECTFNRVKRSFREFFRKATAKRRHPAKKPKAEEVLKGKVK